MAEVEKYIPRRINKDYSPESLISGDRGFLPGDLIDALNARYFNDGADGITKNIKGNVFKLYDEFPAVGESKVIGVVPHKRDNAIIYFIHNTLGDHRVVEYALATEVFTTLLSGSSLGFLPDEYITQGGIIDDLLIWNQLSKAPLKINIVRARALLYTAPYSKESISLGAYPPTTCPTAVKLTTAGVVNFIAKSNWQFSYQYQYQDNETSTWSPVSKLIAATFKADFLYGFDNAIDVTIEVESQLIGIIKAINIAYREGNKGDYTVWDIIENPTLTSYTRRFFNSGRAEVVAKSEEIRIQDAIPPFTKALEIIDSRVFLPLNDVGFDVEQSFTLSTIIAEEAQVQTSGTTGYPQIYNQDQRYFKDGSIHGVGMIFYDDFGRPSFVRASRFLQFERENLIVEMLSVPPPALSPYDYINLGSQRNQKKFIQWTLTGTPPAGIKKYQFVLTKDQFYSVYGQTMVSVFRYIAPLAQGELDNSIFEPVIDLGGGGSATLDPVFAWNGRKFVYQENNEGFSREYKSIYLQIPNNFPFQVEKGDIVRITASSKEFVVKEVIAGYFLDIGKHLDEFLIHDEAWQFAEIYRPSTLRDERFYEIGEVYDIVNNEFSVLSGRINGDTYTISLQFDVDAKFEEIGALPNAILGGAATSTPPQGRGRTRVVPGGPTGIASKMTERIESPSPVFDATGSGYNSINYAKSDSDYGRPHTTSRNEKKQNFYSTFGFSDTYVQGTNINGLSTFQAANQYPIPVERGPITAFKRVGQVLLAFHERETSTLYIGEGLIRQGNDFILAKTESVVGDDRQLRGGYGTINPESITEAYDVAYWWDAHKGAVVRYTNAGLYPISANGMETYFYNKGIQLFPYRNQVKVITAFDYRHKELIISFGDAVSESGAVLVPGETWVFSIKDNTWKSRMSYQPEMMASLNLTLLSFKNGAMWEHHKNELFNNFYGQQYGRLMRFAANPQLGKNKRFLNIHIKGNIALDPTSETQVVKIYTPEGQESFIPAYEFELDEGKNVAPILKDINSPAGSGLLPLRSGDDIVSNYMEFEVNNDRTDEAPCSQINVVYKTEEYSV